MENTVSSTKRCTSGGFADDEDRQLTIPFAQRLATVFSRQADAPEQVLKTGILAHGIEEGLYFEKL